MLLVELLVTQRLTQPVSFDEIISSNKGETMEFEPEPLPDAKQVKRKGRPKKSNDDAAKEREADVDSKSKQSCLVYVRTV